MHSRDKEGLCMDLEAKWRFGSDFCLVCKSLAVKKWIWGSVLLFVWVGGFYSGVIILSFN